MNKNLNQAKVVKNDEFYTQYADVEKEVLAYVEYEPGLFENKIVLLPCDDPVKSNFVRFFVDNFNRFGLKKLIACGYANADNANDVTLFNMNTTSNDTAHGKVLIVTREMMKNKVSFGSLGFDYLVGDGDYNSSEVSCFRDEADFIITNPPFSLFKDFLPWAMKDEKKVLVLGTINAVTYKSVFSLVKENELWLGASPVHADMVFAVPKHVSLKESDVLKASKMGYDSNDDYNYTRLGNSCWFTNIEHSRRHEWLELLTMSDNRLLSKYKKIRENGYPVYDNYDMIEVSYVSCIPSDYDGLMAVPVSFLGVYNPDQFTILGTTEDSSFDNPGRIKWYSREEETSIFLEQNGFPGRINLNSNGVLNNKVMYKRLIIKHK